MPFLLQFFLFFFPLLAVHPLICAACHCQNRTTTMETNLYPARPSGLSYTHTQAYHMRPRASHALVVLQTSGWGGGVGLLLGFTGAIVNVAVNVILIRIRKLNSRNRTEGLYFTSIGESAPSLLGNHILPLRLNRFLALFSLK